MTINKEIAKEIRKIPNLKKLRLEIDFENQDDVISFFSELDQTSRKLVELDLFLQFRVLSNVKEHLSQISKIIQNSIKLESFSLTVNAGDAEDFENIFKAISMRGKQLKSLSLDSYKLDTSSSGDKRTLVADLIASLESIEVLKLDLGPTLYKRLEIEKVFSLLADKKKLRRFLINSLLFSNNHTRIMKTNAILAERATVNEIGCSNSHQQFFNFAERIVKYKSMFGSNISSIMQYAE